LLLTGIFIKFDSRDRIKYIINQHFEYLSEWVKEMKDKLSKREIINLIKIKKTIQRMIK